MAKKTIRITCEGADMVPLEELLDFQGELKRLEERQYKELRQSIIDDGFHTAVDVWRKPRDKKPRKMLDGHQRIRALRTMIAEEGYVLPGGKVPVDWIDAKTEKQAKRMVLEKMSQYGRYDQESIYEFMSENALDWSDVKAVADFPLINMGTFEIGYFGEPDLSGVDTSGDDGGNSEGVGSLPRDRFEQIEISKLKPHPRNYRIHHEDQIAHLVESIRQFGFYRNVVVARDYTILAGHGVVVAAKELDLERVPCVRLDLDPEEPKALKLLAGDNETTNLGEKDDRTLTELLKEVHDAIGLEGSGFDSQMLANYIMVSRSAAEIKNLNEAAAWIGLPGFEPATEPKKLIVMFEDPETRLEFIRKTELKPHKLGRTASAWWPDKGPRQDLTSVLLDDSDEPLEPLDNDTEEDDDAAEPTAEESAS